jgi:hypothetical protein
MLLSSCGLRDNPCSERHTVLRGANGILVPFGLRSSHMSTKISTVPLSSSTIGGGKAVLSLPVQIKLHLRLYGEALRNFEIKGRLRQVCAVRHKVHRYLQCCDLQDDARKDTALLALSTGRSFNRDLESF